MYTSAVFKIWFALFVLDVILRRFQKEPIQKAVEVKNKEEQPKKIKENIVETIDVSWDDEDDEDEDKEGIDTQNKKETNVNQGKKETDEDINDEVFEDDDKYVDINDADEAPKQKKKKNTKVKSKSKKKPRHSIWIKYDKKSYQKFFDQFKLDLMGNFTDFDVEEEEYPVSPTKKYFSKFTFISQMAISMAIFGGAKLKDYITFIPSNFFDMLESKKWFIWIGNYLFHNYLNNFLSTSGAFEILVDDVLVYSKLTKRILPKIKDLERIFLEKGILLE